MKFRTSLVLCVLAATVSSFGYEVDEEKDLAMNYPVHRSMSETYGYFREVGDRFSIIDGDVSNVSMRVNDIEGSMWGVNSRLTELEEAIKNSNPTTGESFSNENAGKMYNHFSGRIDAQTEAISYNTTRLGDLGYEVSENKREMYGHFRDLGNAIENIPSDADLEGIRGSLSSVESISRDARETAIGAAKMAYRVDNANRAVSTANSASSTAENALSQVNSKMEKENAVSYFRSVGTALDDVRSDIGADIANTNSNLKVTGSALAVVNDKVDKLARDIEGMQGGIPVGGVSETQLKSTYDHLNSRIENIEDSIKNPIPGTEGSLSIGDASKMYDNLNGRIEATENEMLGVKEKAYEAYNTAKGIEVIAVSAERTAAHSLNVSQQNGMDINAIGEYLKKQHANGGTVNPPVNGDIQPNPPVSGDSELAGAINQNSSNIIAVNNKVDKNTSDIKTNKENINTNKENIQTNKENIDKIGDVLETAFTELKKWEPANISHIESQVAENSARISSLTNESRAGIASAIAHSQLDIGPVSAGEIGIGVGLGSFKSAGSTAVGLVYGVSNDILTKASVAYNTEGDVSFGTGIMWKFKTR